jgi:hypothetical protein
MPRLISSAVRLVASRGVLGLAAAVALSACVSTSPPPPPPPPPSSGAEAATLLPDWRAAATVFDQDRLDRLESAWSLALEQAGRLRGSGNLRALGDLISSDAQRPSVRPPVGDYRCRTVKLGSQAGEEGLGYVVYGWFACRIEETPAGLKFVKLTGSQRPAGLLFPEDDRRMVLLGSMALGSEPPANSYGERPDRDMIAILERVGERRWRLVIPWPHTESNLDLIELVPA